MYPGLVVSWQVSVFMAPSYCILRLTTQFARYEIISLHYPSDRP